MHALGQLLDRDRGVTEKVINIMRSPVAEAENETRADKPTMLRDATVRALKVHLEPRLLGRLPSAVRVLDAISAVA
jgi:hypothetical protein